jgi:GTP 3',8-cyclase
MPPEGLDWLPGPALLTDGEVSRLISVAVQRLGVTDVRFTGGEPLLRRGLTGLVAAAAALDPRPEISLTTNGIGLARLAGPLAAAGLDRLNVSLDTLSPQTFKELARRDRLPDVLAGLAAAADAGLAPVKVNAVLMRGVNDHEAPGLLRFCLDRGYQLRFIEQMPLDAQHGWRRTDMVTARIWHPPGDTVQLLLGISTETLVALTAATASIPGSRPSSSAASRLSSDTNLCGPAWIST